jgi:hypothetical protein|tara:strand:- start:3037 stop:3393 length:357 start_codon:yes stop_codon:yes gene_type:complete
MKDNNKIGHIDEYIYYCENNKFYREHASADCFRVGDILVISQLEDDFGVGMILHLDEATDSCKVHWQKINIAKWHNMLTLLLLLKQGRRKIKKSHLALEGVVESYIIHTEEKLKREEG